MTLGRLHRWSLTGSCAVAALGTASGSYALATAAGVLILIMLATQGQLHEVERPPLRTWFVHAVTVAVLVWAIMAARTARIDAVVIIVMLGIFNRFVLRQGLRDDLILLGGAAVLLAVSTTITPGLAFLPIFLGFLWMSYGALRSAQIIGLAENESDAERPTTRQALLLHRAPAGQGKLVLIAIVFVFFGYLGLTLFPKHQFARLLGAGAFMSLPGATDTMTLTNNGVGAGPDGTVVLRVTRPPGSEASLSGLYAKLYGLDDFDGRSWSGVPRSSAAFPILSKWKNWAGGDGTNRVEVVMHRIERGSTMHPVAVLGRHRPSRMTSKERQTHSNLSGTWYTSMPISSVQLSYGVDLSVKPLPQQLPSSAKRQQEARLSRPIPSLNPKIQRLAQTLTATQSTVDGKIRAVLRHFNQGYTYTIDPIDGESEDPLSRFLFEAKKGHCELYAGALAVMLRTVGIPARVVTGYYGGWWNSPGQVLEFTEQDAHAWVEAYDPERGWIWVDATPSSERARRTAKAWGWIRDLYDALEALWFNNVVDFDERKRRMVMGRIKSTIWRPAWADAGMTLEGGLQSVGLSAGGRARAAGIGAVVLLIACVGWLVLAVRRRRAGIGQRLRRALDPTADPSLPMGRLLETVPDAAKSEAKQVVDAYNSWRFADGNPGQVPPTLYAAVRGLRRRIDAARHSS